MTYTVNYTVPTLYNLTYVTLENDSRTYKSFIIEGRKYEASIEITKEEFQLLNTSNDVFEALCTI